MSVKLRAEIYLVHPICFGLSGYLPYRGFHLRLPMGAKKLGSWELKVGKLRLGKLRLGAQPELVIKRCSFLF